MQPQHRQGQQERRHRGREQQGAQATVDGGPAETANDLPRSTRDAIGAKEQEPKKGAESSKETKHAPHKSNSPPSRENRQLEKQQARNQDTGRTDKGRELKPRPGSMQSLTPTGPQGITFQACCSWRKGSSRLRNASFSCAWRSRKRR